MILLDTHAFVWLVSEPEQLGKAAKKAIKDSTDGIAVSSITALELALLVKKSRLELPYPAKEYFRKAIEHYSFVELALESDVLFKSAELPYLHDDPFDRILIAQAMISKATLLSKDRKLALYPEVEVLW